MENVIIIGAGPAGISAGIYLLRSKINVLIIDNKSSSLLKAKKIDNYYGFMNGISGSELYCNGIKQFENLGGKIIYDEIVGLNYFDNFILNGVNSNYEASILIIATGTSHLLPSIKGLKEGPHISFCAICDSFFYRNKKVCILGNGQYALTEASHLANVVKQLTILTNGKDIVENNYACNNNKIKEIQNDGDSINVTFSDDTIESFDGMFIAEGIADATALAKKIGIKIQNNKLITDENMCTNVPNIYAIGDCRMGEMQVARAVNDGMIAALDIIRKKNNNGKNISNETARQ